MSGASGRFARLLRRAQGPLAPTSTHRPINSRSSSVICVALFSGIAFSSHRLLVDLLRVLRHEGSACAASPLLASPSLWHITQRCVITALTSAKVTAGAAPAAGWRRAVSVPARRDDHADQHRRSPPQRTATAPAGRAPAPCARSTNDMPDQRARQHHQHQPEPVVRCAVQEAEVVAEHRDQHRQREEGVVHAALLAALAVDRVHRRGRQQGWPPPCAGRG